MAMAQEGKDRTVLVDASSNNFPPMNFLTEEGKLDGFGPELADAVGKAVRIEIAHIHSSQWVEVLEWLDSEKADFIHDAGYTAERAKFLDYSDPILEMPEMIFVRPEQYDISGLQTLKGKKVACVKEHISHLYLDNVQGVDCYVVKTPVEGLYELISGKVDAFVYPKQIILYLAQNLRIADKIKTTGAPLRTLTWSMVVQKGNSDVLSLLNEGIESVKASGEYDRIYKKWWGRKALAGYSKRELHIITTVAVIVSIIIVSSLTLLFYSYKLRKGKNRLEREIFERRKAEEALVKSEERFQLAIKFANDGLFDWNLVTHEIYYSPVWKSLLGYRDDEIANEFSQWETLTHPEDIGSSWAMLKEVLDGKRDRFEKEFRMRHKDGHWVYILSRANITYDEKGKAVRVVGTHVDVSKRKMYENALRESEEKYRRIFENSVVGFFQSTPEGKFISVNRAFAHMMRYDTPDDLVSSISDIATQYYVNPNDRQKYRQLLEKSGKIDGFEFKVRCKDGSEIWVSNSTHAYFGENGEVLRYEGIISDITARKLAEAALVESEANLKALIENTDSSIWSVDSNYRLIIANHIFIDNLRTAFGRAIPIGETVLPETIPKADRDQWKGYYDRALKGEGFRIEARRRFLDQTRWMEYHFSPIRSNGDQILGATVLGRDITDTKEAERKLLEYSEGLEKMVEERTRDLKKAQKELLLKERLAVLGHFSGSISHEIRNPLAAIDSSVYYLQMKLGDGDENTRQHLKRISSNVQKATSIIKSLINLTRMEKPLTQRHSLNDLIAQTLKSMGIPNEIDLITNLHRPDIMVDIDPEQIRMALKNIINNAVQAIDGKGALTITSKPEIEKRFELVITNSGKGISPDHIDRVFEPLFTTKTHGIGFGLSITKMIIENHGGHIRAESEPNSGASFIIDLPLSQKGNIIGKS